MFTSEDCADFMLQLKHLAREEEGLSPRIISSPDGRLHNHEAVLLLEDSALPARRRSLSMQNKVNCRLNPTPEAGDELMIATSCGTVLADQPSVLMLEDEPNKGRRLSLQKKRNSILNPSVAPMDVDADKMIISDCGTVHEQDVVLLLEDGTQGSPSKRRRSLSSMKKRDSIINRNVTVEIDEEDEDAPPPKMIGSPCGKILPQPEVKLLMSPTSVHADHKHFQGHVPALVL